MHNNLINIHTSEVNRTLVVYGLQNFYSLPKLTGKVTCALTEYKAVSSTDFIICLSELHQKRDMPTYLHFCFLSTIVPHQSSESEISKNEG